MRRAWTNLLPWLFLCCGCAGELAEVCRRTLDDVTVRVNLSLDCHSTRSGYDLDEDRISDVNLFVYSDGILKESLYSSDPDALTLQMNLKRKYRIYAVGNSGKIEPPETEDSIVDVVCSRGLSESGHLPVCGVSPEISPEHISGDLKIDMVRLAAKYRLAVDRSSLSRSTIRLTSVKLCQAADDVRPFSGSSVPESVSDGDCASYKDINMLNSGGEAVFYMLENCQGVLLPENQDPWEKIPDNIPLKKDVCTYLEIKARYSAAGISSDELVYRMYLGKDNVSDFNIVRNTDNLLTLSVTDEGAFRVSWRVDIGNVNDRRKLYFTRKVLEVYKDGMERSVDIYRNYYDMDYSVVPDLEAFEAAGLSYRVSGNTVSVRTGSDSPGERTARLFLSSWDGLLKDTCLIRTPDITGVFSDYIIRAPEYYGQWGTIEFPGASADNPVIVSAGSHSFVIGGDDMNEALSSGYRMVYLPEDRTKLYLNAISDRATEFTLRQGGDVTFLSLTPKLPRIGLYYEDIRDVLAVSECGEPYDLGVCLLDVKWTPISLYSFFFPDRIAKFYGEKPYYSVNETFNICFENPGFESNFNIEYVPGSFGPDEGESYLFRIKVCGLEADGTNVKHCVLNLYDDNFSKISSDLKVDVTPAFSGQGYKGEIVNWQIAPGSLQSYKAICPVWCDADTEIRRYCCNGSVEENLEMCFEEGEPCNMMSVSGSTITFRDPSPSDDFFEAGAYVIRKKVVNPYTGRVYFGYYSFDIILYMSIIASVDLRITGSSSSLMYMSYVPLSRFSSGKYADFWSQSNVTAVQVYNNYYKRAERLAVHENPANSVTSFYLPVALDNRSSYSAICNNIDVISWYEFSFFNQGKYSDTYEYCRKDIGTGYSEGSFYRMVRHCDLEKGLQGYVLEAYYKDFYNY